MRALKTGLNADKFATLWMFPKRFYQSVLQMTLIYSRRCWTQVHSRDFKTLENVWIRVKRNAVRALFVISKTTFTETAIKTKFVDRFFKTFLVH